MALLDIWQVVKGLQPKTLEADRVLVEAGKAGEGLYILYSGSLQAEPPPPPAEMLEAANRGEPVTPEMMMLATGPSTLTAGDFFGGTVLMGGLDAPSPVTITAETDSEVLLLTSENFRTLNEIMPSLAVFVTLPCMHVEFDW